MDARLRNKLMALRPGTLLTNLCDRWKEPAHYITVLERRDDTGLIMSAASTNACFIPLEAGPFYVTDDDAEHPFCTKGDSGDVLVCVGMDVTIIENASAGLKAVRMYRRLAETIAGTPRCENTIETESGQWKFEDDALLVAGVLETPALRNSVERAYAILSVLEKVPLEAQHEVIACFVESARKGMMEKNERSADGGPLQHPRRERPCRQEMHRRWDRRPPYRFEPNMRKAPY